jgi:hypothetical protein
MSLIDGGYSHETTPRSPYSPGRAQLQSHRARSAYILLSWPSPAAESFPPSGNLSVPETPECLSPLVTSTFVRGRVLPSRLRLLPSPCTRWVVPCSRNFLPYPKFVVSWLLSNTHPPSSLQFCTSLYQRTYSRKF